MQERILRELRQLITKAFEASNLSKIKLSGTRKESSDSIKEVSIRLIELKSIRKLQFVYKYPTKDITKNHTLNNALSLVEDLLVNKFKYLSLITKDGTRQVDAVKWKSHGSKSQGSKTITLDHNKHKATYIKTASPYLKDLGIAGEHGIKNSGLKKFRQINKYIEIVSPMMAELEFPKLRIVDMGCGKGYLTFALHEHLTEHSNSKIQLTGVEIREALVAASNEIVRKYQLEGISFEKSNIEEYSGLCEVLIALHACDTATDDALIKGVQSEAELIICSPCCHKQVRCDMNDKSAFMSLKSDGIIKERQAEILTDVIRGLILNYHGYKTKIMEFIHTEHTPKNLLLIGRKIPTPTPEKKTEILNEIQALKETFGIGRHYLEEKLLQDSIQHA